MKALATKPDEAVRHGLCYNGTISKHNPNLSSKG